MTTTVCDALHRLGLAAATLSADPGDGDLFSAAGWLSTAVTEALEDRPLDLAVAV
ncbi:hypothetical protein SAMN05660199_00293 [Klenkia soli]|uniref:Uncharacterized protein n=1 Tax=Klenkia soli TaxID=1052260 RepID=A0A1H0CFN3_9ACTN|nr:hypothetical protein [Klenkia soli]SDN56623.1 hypothetical protein SAMN05660199_00293 [Klenkia soli]